MEAARIARRGLQRSRERWWLARSARLVQRQQRRESRSWLDAQRQHAVRYDRLWGAYGYGAVFSVPVGGGSPTVLASFDGSDGEYPVAGLTLIGNTLYGTTYAGGAYYDGTVFSVPVSGGSPTVVASFNGGNGAYPEAGLTLSGNTLYGTTLSGGVNNNGTVFALTVPEPSTIASC